jgi:hypothetical protein
MKGADAATRDLDNMYLRLINDHQLDADKVIAEILEESEVTTIKKKRKRPE